MPPELILFFPFLEAGNKLANPHWLLSALQDALTHPAFLLITDIVHIALDLVRVPTLQAVCTLLGKKL